MSIFSKLYWKIKLERIKFLWDKFTKEAKKIAVAVVIMQFLLAGGYWYAVKTGINEYVDIHSKRTVIIPVHAKTIEKGEASAKNTPEQVEEYPEVGTFYTYNAEKSQTDGNPYRTANGRIVKDGIVANNCLPFGTRISVKGVGELEVQDRMNSRYGCDDFDVFRVNPKDNFKKQLQYKIIK